MEWSKYNLLLTDKGKNHYYLYNTVSGFFVELPKSIYETLLNFEHEDFELILNFGLTLGLRVGARFFS